MKIITCIGLVLVSVSLHAQLTDFRYTAFDKADSVADAHYGAPLLDLRELSERLTASLTAEEEKFRAIFKWVCSNIDFDMQMFRLNHSKRNKSNSPEALMAWNKQILPTVFRNLVLERKTVCTGYAWLVQELARHAGITCMIVDGYGRNASANIRKAGKANHSWNAVKLNGKWYLCDPTWASGTYDVYHATYLKKYDNAYFLAHPKVFIRNHYPLEEKWTLLDRPKVDTEDSKFGDVPETVTLNEFLNGPLIYSSAYQHALTELYPNTFDVVTERDEPVRFRFASTKVMEHIELSVNKDQKANTYQPEFLRDEAGMYSFCHTFADKGRHIVHVMLNKTYAFTYTVTVK